LFVSGVTAPSGPGPSHSQGFYITYNEATHSVGLLWTSDQLVAETSTIQHKTPTTDRHQRPQWKSNLQSQQASGRRPTPKTALPLGPAHTQLHITVKHIKRNTT